MAGYYLVRQARGPSWDPTCGRREQEGWDEHVAFVDRLVDEGVMVLAGPVAEVDGEYVVLVMRAGSEAEIRERLAADPWSDRILRIESIEPWTLWITAPGGVT